MRVSDGMKFLWLGGWLLLGAYAVAEETTPPLESSAATSESVQISEDEALAGNADSAPTPPVTPKYFSNASGYANGVYYMLGTLIGALVSNPPNSLACEKGGTCGAKDMVVSNVSSEGSAANVELLGAGKVDAAFVQSNVAYWAYTASGLYEQAEPQEYLRAIASFYPEMVQLVVRRGSGIKSVSDLVGKRVSLGAEDSGTLVNVRQILTAFGVSEDNFSPYLIDLRQTAELFEAGELDAFFFVGGLPTPLITHLADVMEIDLVAIDGAQSADFLGKNNYYASGVIPTGTYKGVYYDVKTFSVNALWLTTEQADEETIYTLTKLIWNKDNRPYWLQSLLPIGGLEVDHALDGIGIPLHPGAKRYYNEIGKRF